MGDYVEVHPRERRWWRRAAHRSAEAPSTSFPELVWYHRRWREALDQDAADGPQREQAYREALVSFERAHGRIVDAYWCTSDESAVALTELPRRGLAGLLRLRSVVRFHRASDWVTKGNPEVAGLLHRCDALAIRVAEVLRGTPQRICMRLITSSAEHALSLADERSAPPDAEAYARGVENERRSLALTEHYYEVVGQRIALIVYFVGMLLGGLAVLGFAGLFWLGDDFELRDVAIACFLAGALGALISVMARITQGEFTVDYELGRGSLVFFGLLRPLMGAAFGLAIYAALHSGVLDLGLPDPDTTQGFWFFTFFAFVAGFSERLAKDVLDAAENTVAAAVRAERTPPARSGGAGTDDLPPEPAAPGGPPAPPDAPTGAPTGGGPARRRPGG